MLGFRVVHEVVERFVSAVRDRDLRLYGVHVYRRGVAREKVPTTHDLPMFAAGYGLGAWCGMGERTFRMDGHYGQFCIVSPEREAVVTVTAHTERDPELLDLIRDELLDSL